MGTQGIVSVVREGVTRIKIVAGTDGYKAENLAAWLREYPGARASEIFEQAKLLGFGSPDNLIVQFSPRDYLADESVDGLGPLYGAKFFDPHFNPRWEIGTADHVEIVVEEGNLAH